MSLNRIFSLIKLEIAELGSRFWWMLLIVFAVCCIFPMGSFFGFVYACIITVLMNNLHHRFSLSQTTMPYLMIPASTAEKVIANGIIVYIIFNVLVIASGLLGILAGDLVRSYMHQIPFYWEWPISISFILCFNVLLSVFFFSTIYFRKGGITKGCLILLGLGMLISIIDWAIIVGSINESNISNIRFFRSWNPSSLNFNWVFSIIGIVVFLFFNFMSWLRLRETEA